ncbi:glycosyltransferase family 2 protein [Polynucleobacter paneuropaeus]|uniref:glycosyltransferase family 2 protein n=1 Tax=Polynucleobacter paneuropaeus TaxID=2527775 RepID=UPI000DBF230C|nr:glycosyltransferase family 2 protein [Polynucleobacter paneuropaeus]AWW44057.1 glycosyltransferase [Polynucleobacter paneuropaeus]
MKISVITVCLNSEDTIHKALESISNQSYKNIQHIIIDGESSDNTLSIVKNYKGHKIDLYSGRDDGIYDAMNKGLALATGEVIGFLHADDFYSEKITVEQIANAFLDSNVDGIYGDLAYVSRNDLHKRLRYWRAGIFSTKLLKLGWMPPHPTVYLRRHVYSDIGSFNTKFRISGDYDFILRIFSRNIKMLYLPFLMVIMRAGGISNSSIRNRILKSLEDFEIVKLHKIGGLVTIFCKNMSKISQIF